MIGIFGSILPHITFVEQLLTEPLLSLLYFHPMFGVVDEGYWRILTLLNENFLSSLILANDDFVKYFRHLFHSFLPKSILLRFISTSMMLYHIF